MARVVHETIHTVHGLAPSDLSKVNLMLARCGILCGVGYRLVTTACSNHLPSERLQGRRYYVVETQHGIIAHNAIVGPTSPCLRSGSGE